MPRQEPLNAVIKIMAPDYVVYAPSNIKTSSFPTSQLQRLFISYFVVSFSYNQQ